MAGQQRGNLCERLRFAPVLEDSRARDVGAGDRHAGGERGNRFPVDRDLFLVALGEPRVFTQPVTGVGVRLVADLHPREQRPECVAGGSHLARGRLGVVVREVDGQQHMPSAAAREFADGAHLRRADGQRRPRRAGREPVGPGDVLIRGDAPEADHPGAERAQQGDQVAAMGVSGDLPEGGGLEGEPQKVCGHHFSGGQRINRHPNGHSSVRLAPAGAGRGGGPCEQQHGDGGEHRHPQRCPGARRGR